MLDNGSRNSYVQWYQRHKTLVWGATATAAAASLYAAVKTCSSESVGASADASVNKPQRQQSHFQRIRGALKNYSDAMSTLSETAALVSEDLRTFLTSDSTELPQSLRQLNKLLQAPELQDTVSTVTASVVRGVFTATQGQVQGDSPPLLDTIVEAVLSERGRGLVGMAVGVAVRNATSTVCEFVERRLEASSAPGSSGGLGLKDLLDLLSSDQGERLLMLLLTQGIRTAVTSYVDSTAGYNFYNDALASLVKPEHRDALTDLLSRLTASFCREAAFAYRRAMAASSSIGSGGSISNAANHPAAKYTTSSSSSSAASCGRDSTSSTSITPSVNVGGSLVAGVLPAAFSCTADNSAAGDVRQASLPLAKSNGQLAAGQNGRPAQGSQLHKLQSMAGIAGGCNFLPAGNVGRTTSVQVPPPWLRQFVELVREREVRSLAVDVVKSASREATRGAIEGFFQGSGDGTCRGGVLVMPSGVSGYKLYMLATLAVTLCMYALSPRVMLA